MADETGFILGGGLVTHHELQAQHVYLAHLLEEIHKQNQHILALLSHGGGRVTPELEAAVRQVGKRAISIDKKVPDMAPN